MEYTVLGWAPDGPTLVLDHESFSYAGKFVMSATGKAVVRESITADEAGSGHPADEAGAEHPADEAGSGHPADEAGAEHLADETGPEQSDDDIVAAAAFSEDRTDGGTLWLRYITVRDDRRGEGIGARLAGFVAERARERGYDSLRIAVNNPFAYEALYKVGFAFTGETTGLAELVLGWPPEDGRDRATYQAGLDRYRERDLTGPEREFLAERTEREPPPLVDPPV